MNPHCHGWWKADAVGGGRGVAAPAATKRAGRCKRIAFNVGRTTHREGEELHVDGSWDGEINSLISRCNWLPIALQ